MSFLLLLLHLYLSGGPVIITSGSFQGLAYENGEIIIPPVYDAMGWSDGSVAVHQTVIGFKENNRWGLINLKNKRLSDPAFIELKPFEEGYILAAIQGRFSNLPFYGLLDNSGRTRVRFNYMQLKPLGADKILASTYIKGEVFFGVLNYEGNEIIPLIYDNIELDSEIIIASRKNRKKIYDGSGMLVSPKFIDEIEVTDQGFLLQEGGKYGLITENGKTIHDITYKAIVDHASYNFNKWKVSCISASCSSLEVLADSLTINDKQQIVAHLNNTRHFLGGDSAVNYGNKFEVVSINRGFMVMKNRFDESYSLIKSNGEKVIEGYDNIWVDTDFFYCKKEGKWSVMDNFGTFINNQKYDSIGTSHALKIPIMKNGYWGWLDFSGEKIINNKYDLVIAGVSENQFIAKYINSWGVSNFEGEFAILPRYDTIAVARNFYLAKKVGATDIITSNGKVVLRTEDHVSFDQKESIIKLIGEDGKIGVITDEGIVLPNKYEEVSRLNEYLLLKSSGYFTIYNNGTYILDTKDRTQNILGYSEDYFHIIKEGKHGFVDQSGNLRIANRYADAGDFENGLGAVKIGDRWGFIDASENLIIQPHYNEVSSFNEGLAIAEQKNRFGLIDMQGNTVVSFNWKTIRRLTTGNYLLLSLTDKVGLANEEGKIILRPNYESIEDTATGSVIVKKGKFKGVLDYNGYTKTPFEYEEIEIVGDYLLLLKRKEYVPSQPSPN